MNTDFHQALQQQLTERQRERDAVTGVERIWSRRQIEQAFLETFELIGGVPRLALWANDPQNYEKFLNLLIRLAPKDSGGTVSAAIFEYKSNLAPSRLPPPRRGDDDVVEVHSNE